jgi:hypothetical protein
MMMRAARWVPAQRQGTRLIAYRACHNYVVMLAAQQTGTCCRCQPFYMLQLQRPCRVARTLRPSLQSALMGASAFQKLSMLAGSPGTPLSASGPTAGVPGTAGGALLGTATVSSDSSLVSALGRWHVCAKQAS